MVCHTPCPHATDHCTLERGHAGPHASFHLDGPYAGKERYIWQNERELPNPEQLCSCGAPLREHPSGRLCKIESLRS